MREWIAIVESEQQLASISVVEALKPQMVAVAQRVYDAWDQDEDGYDEEVGSGGICHLIADEIATVLIDAGVETCTVSATHEVHVYCVVAVQEGVFEVDIPYRVYEIGGGYTWKKIPDVVLTVDDVLVSRLDHNPANFHIYVEID